MDGMDTVQVRAAVPQKSICATTVHKYEKYLKAVMVPPSSAV